MSYSKGQTIAVGVIFMILPTVLVGLRVWAKSMSRKGLGWDDYLIFLALVKHELLIQKASFLTISRRLQSAHVSSKSWAGDRSFPSFNLYI